jgi:isopenicillin-N epimerase
VQVLVDGAHAPGMLDLDISRLNPDYYTGNLHKWVCAPKGAAFLWAREDRQPHLHPPIVSHGYNTPRAGYSSFQDRFDWMGTTDPTPWFCAGAAIDWMGQLLPGGWPELRRRNRELAIAARTLLCHTLEVVPPCPESMLAALATIPLPARFQGRPRTGKLDSEQVILSERHQIEVPFFRFGNPERRHIRISAQIYNSLEDYQRLAEALMSL